ncbi:MAG: TetR/AcrR family transcriptional regulator [Oscillospiraceae bacterium]|nr:TetR/AcrR family transcriptional regulator [Oscillospiraceae bacterium]
MDRRTQKTRQAIRNAYAALLLDHHASRITVTALAREANIDRKTFYLHYDTIEDVVRDYHAQILLKMMDYLEAAGFFENRPDISCFFTACNRLIGEEMAFFQYTAQYGEDAVQWQEDTAELVRMIAERYEESVTVRPEVLEVYIRLLIAGSKEIYSDWLRGRLKFDIEELGRIATDAAFEGFSAIMR